MGMFRYVIRITNRDNERSYTEQFYVDLPPYSSPDQVPVATVRATATARAQCLVVGNRIPVVRVNEVTNPKVVKNFPVNLPGVLPGGFAPGNNGGQDVVNISRLVILTANNGAQMKYLQRGCADGDVVNGRFTFVLNGQAVYDNWLEYIKSYPLRLRASTFGPQKDINTIVPRTLTFTNVLDSYAKDTVINIRTQVSGPGPKLNVRAKVAQAAPGSVTLNRWIWGNCTGGNTRDISYTYGAINSYNNSAAEARIRKTGGPLSKFRGRRSSRRQSTGV